jgi:hypothetical protein
MQEANRYCLGVKIVGIDWERDLNNPHKNASRSPCIAALLPRLTLRA